MTGRRADDPSITVRLRPEIITRLDEQCRSRLVGRRLLIERALEDLFDRLESDGREPL